MSGWRGPAAKRIGRMDGRVIERGRAGEGICPSRHESSCLVTSKGPCWPCPHVPRGRSSGCVCDTGLRSIVGRCCPRGRASAASFPLSLRSCQNLQSFVGWCGHLVLSPLLPGGALVDVLYDYGCCFSLPPPFLFFFFLFFFSPLPVVLPRHEDHFVQEIRRIPDGHQSLWLVDYLPCMALSIGMLLCQAGMVWTVLTRVLVCLRFSRLGLLVSICLSLVFLQSRAPGEGCWCSCRLRGIQYYICMKPWTPSPPQPLGRMSYRGPVEASQSPVMRGWGRARCPTQYHNQTVTHHPYTGLPSCGSAAAGGCVKVLADGTIYNAPSTSSGHGGSTRHGQGSSWV